MPRHDTKLLVIDCKRGYISRFVNRTTTNIVHTEAPNLLGNILGALELFRLHGPIKPPPPEAA